MRDRRKSRFYSRADLWDYYESLGEDKEPFYDWIRSLCVDSKQIDYELYHLSRNPKLPRRVKPLETFYGDDKSAPNSWLFYETLPPRFCACPSIEQCWFAINPVLENFYSGTGKETVPLYLYKVNPLRNKVLLPEVLWREYLVYDAHVTGEVDIFGEVELTFMEPILFENNIGGKEDEGDIWSHPYNDKRLNRFRFSTPCNII